LSEKEDIFNEGPIESDTPEDLQESFLEEDSTNKGKMSFKQKDLLLKKICSYCERTKCLYHCEGVCRRNFHE
jgi:hypothetical protein